MHAYGYIFKLRLMRAKNFLKSYAETRGIQQNYPVKLNFMVI